MLNCSPGHIQPADASPLERQAAKGCVPGASMQLGPGGQAPTPAPPTPTAKCSEPLTLQIQIPVPEWRVCACSLLYSAGAGAE